MRLKIDKLVYGPEALAHHNGKPVFIPFVLPGETVHAQLIEDKKKFIRAKPVEILERSPERVDPPCHYFTRCGGCHYQQMPYERQLAAKTEILRETLRRLGKIDWQEQIHTHPSPPLGPEPPGPGLGYRNRAQFKIKNTFATFLQVGYYAPGTSALCPVHHCPIVSPALNRALEVLAQLAAEDKLPPELREAEVFADDRDENLLLTLSHVGIGQHAKSIAELLMNQIPGTISVQFCDLRDNRKQLFGAGHLEYRVCGRPYRVSHASFFQVNRYLVPKMVELLSGESGSLLLDLYAGVGLFSAALAEKFVKVIAIESGEEAARDLAVNLAAAGGKATATRAEVEEWLPSVPQSGSGLKPDLVIVDPPRTGLARRVSEALSRIRPPRMVYFSCDPSTLARDLGILSSAGFRLQELHLLDLFPQTYHIEALAKLSLPV
jgi:23S rRNA (uracil1939-C5)-methyltransferase